MKFLMIGESSSQSVGSHLKGGGAWSWDGDACNMVMRTWSEPIEARERSKPLTQGRSRVLAKARSITEGRAFPERGNLVYTPGDFSRGKPGSTANSKYVVEEETSSDEKERRGSSSGLWMFRSPTTKSGTRRSAKRDSGRTEWTLRSAELIE